MARESGWLRRCPVTAEIMGSNPIRVAIATLDNTLSSPLNLRIEDLLRACSSGGERLLCKQDVGGSIPSRSTICVLGVGDPHDCLKHSRT